MQSGFSGGFSGGGGGGGGGGGLPDLYANGGRSIGNTMNNHPSQNQFHLRSQLPGLFMDPAASQIARQTQIPHHHNTTGLIGKRTLAEFQFHQQHQQQQQNPYNQNLYLRSLKPRTTANFQHSSPISPLSPIDFSSSTTSFSGSDNNNNNNNNSASSASSMLSHQRFGPSPILQQLRHQPMVNPNFQATSSHYISNNNTVLSQSQPQPQFQNRIASTIEPEKKSINIVSQPDSDKKMIDSRLLELEKQLLDDNDEDEEGGDAVSVITKTNSEWSETIQNLISPNNPGGATQKPVSPSPTSSSSSSSSVASPATMTCSKQSLMEAASAISEGKSEAAAEILTRLTQVANPRASSEQRLLDVMASALKSRVSAADNPPPVAELFTKEHCESTQLLYELSPCFRLGFMAANHAILEATLDDQSTTNKVHVIDFDIGQGSQYTLLINALSTRAKGKPYVLKITTVPDNGGEEKLASVRNRLSQMAEGLRVKLEFNVVSQKLSELSRESLGCEPDEVIAVNFAFKLYSMPDESVSTDNPRDELLRRVKGLAPKVVTMVEQELNTNTAPFMARVGECCAYYGALLDSVECMQKERPDRVKAEEALSRKLINSVACEGRDRVERCEVFGKWRARMRMAGFELRPMGPGLTELLKSRLTANNPVPPGFTVKLENGGICFGWISRTLTVASAWC